MIDSLVSSNQTNAFVNHTLTNFDILLNAPINFPEMWWIITPLLVTFLVMTLYFGVYRKEEMGWNSALGNSIVLFFIVVDQIRHMFYYTNPGSPLNFLDHPLKTAIIGLIIMESFLLLYITSTHALPKKLAFFIASPTSINLQAYVLITIVYTQIEPTWYILSAAMLLYVCLLLFTIVIHFIQYFSMRKEHKEHLKEANELRKQAGKARADARSSSDRKARHLRKQAERLIEKAQKKETEVMIKERERFGKLLSFSKYK